MLKDNDQLLYVLSAKKEMGLPYFKETFDVLYQLHNEGELIEAKNQRWETITALNNLGFCEINITDSNSKIYATPSALIRLPSVGFPQAILTGARSPKTIEKLIYISQKISSDITIEIQEQEQLILVPKMVAIQGEKLEHLFQIAEKLKIAFSSNPSAWMMVNFSASINEYRQTLKWENTRELNWKKETFTPDKCKFDVYNQNREGVTLTRYTHPHRQTKIYCLWRGEKSTEVDPDWGRYLVLKDANMNVITYDDRRFTLAVPVGAKLPKLFARSLTFCSGYAAKFVEKLPFETPKIYGFHIYKSIPPQIAEMVTDKLGQKPMIKSLE